jgi:hypothetical protein
MTKEELFELTAIDPWWLAQLEELHTTEVRPARQPACYGVDMLGCYTTAR